MVRMVGAMPAVAVRQQRKHVRHEEAKRPSSLTLDTPHHHPTPPTRSPRGSPPTPKNRPHPHNGMPHPYKGVMYRAQPVAASQPKDHKKCCCDNCAECRLCGVFKLLHFSVLLVLLGVVLLVLGLVQLAPGTSLGLDTWTTLGAGTGCVVTGFVLLILLCVCQRPNGRTPQRQHQALQAHAAAKMRGKSAVSRHMQVATVEGTASKLTRGDTRTSSHYYPSHPSATSASRSCQRQPPSSADSHTSHTADSDPFISRNGHSTATEGQATTVKTINERDGSLEDVGAKSFVGP